MADLATPPRVMHGRLGWLALAAMLLAGCGDRSPVTVGFMGGMTGRAADLGVGGRDAVSMAVEEANAASIRRAA